MYAAKDPAVTADVCGCTVIYVGVAAKPVCVRRDGEAPKLILEVLGFVAYITGPVALSAVDVSIATGPPVKLPPLNTKSVIIAPAGRAKALPKVVVAAGVEHKDTPSVIVVPISAVGAYPFTVTFFKSPANLVSTPICKCEVTS